MQTIESRTIEILGKMIVEKITEAELRLGEGNRNVITDFADYQFHVGGVQALKGIQELIAIARTQAENEAGAQRGT